MDRFLLHKNYTYIIVCLLTFTTLFFLFFNWQKNIIAINYFEEVLQKHNIVEDVLIDGNTYSVTNGNILNNNQNISVRTKYLILRTVYAKSLAKRAPLFTLNGTNIEAFRKNVNLINDNRKELSVIQDTFIERFLVYHTLYPLNYLYLLADTEEARRLFVLSGDSRDLELYNKYLNSIPKEYKRSLFMFTKSFQFLVPDTGMSYVTELHIINKKNSLTTFKSLKKRTDEIGHILRNRKLCIDGQVTFCQKDSLSLPEIKLLEPLTLKSIDEINIKKVNHYYKQLALQYTDTDYPINDIHYPNIVIDKSFCLNTGFPPIFMTYGDIVNGGIAEAEDIRFVNANTLSSIPFFLAWKKLGIEYVPASPLRHYTCMLLNRDIGAVYSIKNVVLSLNKFKLSSLTKIDERKEVLLTLETDLQKSIVTEYSAKKYIQIGLDMIKQKVIPVEKKDLIIDLAIQINNESGGSEFLINSIAGDSSNLRILKKGFPTNLQSEHLFFARSGFVLLSMVGNKSFGKIIDVFNLSKISEEDKPFLYLSDLINDGIPLVDIVKGVYEYNHAHK